MIARFITGIVRMADTTRSLLRSGFTCAALLMLAGVASAAGIKVISTLNIRPALDELVAPFERATGTMVTIESQPATATRLRIERGDPGDVVIHARTMLEILQKAGLLTPGSIVDVSHAPIGVIVRRGAPQPDISTDLKLRQALLAASTITYPDPAEGSLGGNYLFGLFARWGISDKLAAKTTLAGGGADAGKRVAAGDAQLGLNQVSELMMVNGIEFVAPLPPSLNRAVVMSAAVLPGSHEPQAAAAWVQFLASPAAAKALRAHGMEP
jgi:molybdate transport system substrate-binding protein